MITTIGVAFVLINIVLMIWGPQSKPFPKIMPDRRWAIGQAEIIAEPGPPASRRVSS